VRPEFVKAGAISTNIGSLGAAGRSNRKVADWRICLRRDGNGVSREESAVGTPATSAERA